MASASSIIKKVSAILNKVGPPDKSVYLRVTTRTNQDVLKGYPGTVTTTDTLLNPQPYYTRSGRDRTPGGHTKSEDAVTGDGTVTVLDDWVFFVSPDAITPAQLSSPDFLLVWKINGAPAEFGSTPFNSGTESISTSNEQVFKLLDTDAAMIYGADVLYSLYMRSITRS
jgi:hypothetical protein